MMFQIKASNKDVMVHAADNPMFSSAAFTAFNPKYGSMTTAFKWNFWFNPARIGRNVLISPAEPTFNVLFI